MEDGRKEVGPDAFGPKEEKRQKRIEKRNQKEMRKRKEKMKKKIFVIILSFPFLLLLLHYYYNYCYCYYITTITIYFYFLFVYFVSVKQKQKRNGKAFVILFYERKKDIEKKKKAEKISSNRPLYSSIQARRS